MKLKDILSALKGSIPTEIHRKTFDSEDIANWKATHYRFFLLYGGPFLLKLILPKRLYRHFLHWSIASRILCHSTLTLTHTDIADDLLLKFVFKILDLYGESIQSINFHNLLHLIDDVRQMQAALTAYSAFYFENLLRIIKKIGLIHSWPPSRRSSFGMESTNCQKDGKSDSFRWAIV